MAASIVLHHFAVWASYPEREREGYKFKVGAGGDLALAVRRAAACRR